MTGSVTLTPGENNYEERDLERTGQVRCIGCGKFVAAKHCWNQCPDCDVRYPEEK